MVWVDRGLDGGSVAASIRTPRASPDWGAWQKETAVPPAPACVARPMRWAWVLGMLGWSKLATWVIPCTSMPRLRGRWPLARACRCGQSHLGVRVRVPRDLLSGIAAR